MRLKEYATELEEYAKELRDLQIRWSDSSALTTHYNAEVHVGPFEGIGGKNH